MESLATELRSFFQKNAPAMILNTSTQQALLCLNPQFEEETGTVLMKFESLNERGGNSARLKRVQGFTKNTLYVENDEENVLMLQKLTPANYNMYIRKQYADAPEASTVEEIKKIIDEQNHYA